MSIPETPEPFRTAAQAALRPMDRLEQRFREQLGRLGRLSGTGVVAVSGGTDSLVLLDLMVRTRELHGLALVVAHVDHGLHPDSALVARRVAAHASALGLVFETTRLSLAPGASETAARGARWRWLRDLRGRLAPALIFAAHHRDDQLETVMMRVLRGSGPAGLAGMPALGDGVVRPLLAFGRAELADHARAQGLAPWDDPANRDPRHLRSWIRNDLLPAIRGRLPDLDARLLSLAEQAAHDRGAWDAAIEALQLDCRMEQGGISVASGPLRSYDSTLAARLLMAAARRIGLVLGPRRARAVVALAGRGRSGARLSLGGGWLAELRFERVALVSGARRRHNQVPDRRIQLPAPGTETELEGWRMRCTVGPPPPRCERGGWSAWLIPGPYEIRPWRPGDRILPLGGRGRRLVVRCMQDAKVGRSERPGWPVVIKDGAIVWVPGICRSAHQLPAAGSEAWRIDVERA